MINTNTKSPVLIGLTTTLQLKPQRKKNYKKREMQTDNFIALKCPF